MCGLCGMAGPGISLDDRKIFRDLLYVTALRGDHSTGVATVKLPRHKKDREKILLKKKPYDAAYFIHEDEKEKKGILDDFWADIFIGHCRYATVGKINTENAHPFDLDKLIGAHNGTLTGKEFSSDKKTDSELMFMKMEKDGVVGTLDNLAYGDAFAVSVYQKDREIITLSRNHRRTLFIATNKDRGVLYWSSEYDMLKFALERRNQKYEIFYLEPYKVYNIDWNEIRAGNDSPFDIIDLEDKRKNQTSTSSRIVTSPTYQSNYDDIQWDGVLADSVQSFTSDLFDDVNDDPWYDYKCSSCNKKLGFKEAMKRRIEEPAKEGGVYVHYVCSAPVCQKELKDRLSKGTLTAEEIKKVM